MTPQPILRGQIASMGRPTVASLLDGLIALG
jgi:hypothetical protein